MLKVFSWSLFVFWLLIRSAFEHKNHTSLNRVPSRWILATQITQIGISGSDWNRKCFATRTRAGYAKSRISYYNNCSATFNYQYLRLSGDISLNPGSKSTRICAACGRAVARNHRATRCDDCSSWTHIKCGGVLPKEYHHMKSTGNFSRTCRSCLVLLQQLPFANSSLNSSSNSEPESIAEEQNVTSMWTEFDNIVQNYRLNFKLGHVNANSIGGFKFYEIRTWLLSGRFDILVISETKIDCLRQCPLLTAFSNWTTLFFQFTREKKFLYLFL